MRLIDEIKLDFKDVLIVPKRSGLNSRSQVELRRSYTFVNSKNTWEGIPIMAANMDTTGTFEMAEVMAKQEMITCIDKHYGIEDWRKFAKKHPEYLKHVAVTSGNSDQNFKKLCEILSEIDVGFINVDVANGYTESFSNYVRRVRAQYPNKNIIAGNVVTSEMVEQLLLIGADIVKSGVGSGSVCTTRLKTGVGYPQLSASIEGSDAAHGLKGHLISDGGCTVPGDVAKAFGAGADFVMLGGMLAGHTESGGEIVRDGGREFKQFYGMASQPSLDKYSDAKNEYRTNEGKEVRVPHRGPLIATLRDICGGLRSTCAYVGAHSLRELSKRTTFVRVSQQANAVFNRHETGK